MFSNVFKKNRPDIITGKKYEEAFLGRVDVDDAKYKKELEGIRRHSSNPRMPYYYNFNDSLELAKKFQPFSRENKDQRVDPADPEAPLLRDLRLEILDMLGLPLEEEEKVKLYTAVDTPLDILHGVDAFVEIDDYIITIDLTLKEEVEDKTADVIIAGEIPDPNVDEDGYLKRITSAAKEVSDIFLERKYEDKEGKRVG